MEVPAIGDQLLNVLKPAFSSGGSVSADALRKQFGGPPAANVSASALNEAAAGGSVEAFPLVRPSDQVRELAAHHTGLLRCTVRCRAENVPAR